MEIVTITEARRRLRGALSSYQPETEQISPEDAVGRITAKDITAAHPYPPYRKSPFDGYAICSHNQKTYDVVATIGAGIVYDGPVRPGQAVRLMTGCAVPDDCDTVIPQEYTVKKDDRIELTENIDRGSNIIPIGEECQKGAVIIPKGTKLTAGAVSAAVGMGNTVFSVFTKTKVLFLTSGRELVLPGEARHKGQIYNSNAFLFRPILEQHQAEVTFYHVSDGPERLDAETEKIRTLSRNADLIVSTGGVSVGLYDTMPQIYGSLGAVQLYNRITMRPGSASYGGVIKGASGKATIVLGLSGNPSAAFNAFQLLTVPILRQLNGEEDWSFSIVTCRLSHAIHKENPVDRFVQGRISFEGGQPFFTPNTTLTSSALLGLSQVNALGCIKKGTPPLSEGAPIEAILLP
ncbi:molybdopterin molybdotransferase MoeA [uncultured Megasphaera sp.]|uniref:molybdopterin molybdotransferase MoeA n=1 Tax=uncultured Megasphaera sp. TaxID=165188 RepID=UPI0025EDCF19|nr:molybdopterin molybdotransferase MoeA [uncultured Megasphaera sp.]